MNSRKLASSNGCRSLAVRGSSAPWPEPQSVAGGRPQVPPFDVEWLPASLAPWIADVADRVQCPPDFVAVGALVAAAAVIGRKVAMRPKRQDDTIRPVGLSFALSSCRTIGGVNCQVISRSRSATTRSTSSRIGRRAPGFSGVRV